MMRKVIRHWPLAIVLPIVLVAWGGVASYYYLDTQHFIQQETARTAEFARVGKEARAKHDKRMAEQAKKRAEAEQAAKAEAEALSAAAAAATGLTLPTTSAGCNTAKRHLDPSSPDLLVNKKHCLIPLTFAPDIISVADGAMVARVAHADYVAMTGAAATAGVPLSVTSSYRSYSNQVATYQHWVTVNGSQASADTVSARPGFSEHQTGLAIDFAAGGCSLECFTGSQQYRWLQENAASYGFIQRYPSGKESITGYATESWHYRYVGKETAQGMKQKGITTLEEYWSMPGGDYN